MTDTVFQRFVNPFPQFVDANGNPLIGAKLFFSESGSTFESAPKNTYSDVALTTANPNPAITNSVGMLSYPVFLDAGDYRVVLKDETEATTYGTADPLRGDQFKGLTASIVELNATDTSVKAESANYTVLLTDRGKTIAMDASAGARTVTLLAPATAGNGFTIHVVKSDSSANDVSVAGATVIGAKSIKNTGAGFTLVCDGQTGYYHQGGSNSAATGGETGDMKYSTRGVPSDGWMLYSNGTIGPTGSSATLRANDDVEALYKYLWKHYSDTLFAVAGGRGASADADWQAATTSLGTKLMTMHDIRDNAFVVTGNSYTPGEKFGQSSVTLTEAELPIVDLTAKMTDSGHSHTVTTRTATPNIAGTGGSYDLSSVTSTTSTSTTGITFANLGGGTAHENRQPSVAWYVHIKL